MSQHDAEGISAFLVEQYALWNRGDRTDFFALFRRWAPQGMTVEYVGGPVLEGWKAINDIWDRHGGLVIIEVLQILVNGNEAAVHALNHHSRGDECTTRPSIEIYHFTQGTLAIRYFYATSP